MAYHNFNPQESLLASESDVAPQKEGYQKHYTASYLQPKTFDSKFFDQQIRYSDQYLKHVSKFIDLSKIYKVVDCLFFNQEFEFAACQVEIMDERLRKDFGGNFLLQIWNKDKQKKIFERVLQEKVPYWSQSGQYIIYKKANTDFFNLVNCLNSCSVLKVKDWLNDSSFKFAVMGAGKLTVANSREIQVAFVPDNMGPGLVAEEVTVPTQIYKYSPGKAGKIQSLYAVKNTISNGSPMVLLEVEDGQLDVNRFVCSQESDGSARFMLEELTDYAPWQIRNSPIVKVWIVKITQFVQFFALREGGDVDIYVNFDRICTIQGQHIVDIDYDSKNIYFKTESGQTRSMPAVLNMKMNWSNTQECTQEWDQIILGKVGVFFDPYSSMAFVGDNVFISHGHFLTQYNLVKRFFVHFKFRQPLEACFKFNPTGINNDYHPYVLTAEGQIFKDFERRKPEKEIVEIDQFHKNLSHKMAVRGWAIDRQNFKYCFVYGDQGVFLLYQEQLLPIPDIQGMHNKGRIVTAESKEKDLRFVVQDENRIYNYVLRPPQQGQVKLDLIQEPVDFIEVDTDSKEKKQLRLGQLHSAAVHPDQALVLLVDSTFVYVLNEKETDKKKQIKRLRAHDIKAFCFPESKYVYTLKAANDSREGGLYLYEGLSIFQKGTREESFKLTEAQVTLQGHIDLNYKQQRLAFMKNLELIEVLPIPHFNTIPFQNFPAREDVLCTKRDQERFSVLTFSGWLYTWNVSSGNLMQEIDLKAQLGNPKLFDGYKTFAKLESEFTYASHSQEFSLIYHVDKAPLNEQEFYPDYMNDPAFDKQQRFNKKIGKSFHKFRMVRIESPNQIEIVREFHFPIADEGTDVLHISTNGNFLYQELKFRRVFLYEFVCKEGNLGHFKLVNKLIQFPTTLAPAFNKAKMGIRCIQSPDLKRYLDWDQKEQSYCIFDMFSREIVSKIPVSILNDYGQGSNKLVVNRFKWLDSRYFVCVDKEGIEKVVDANKNPAQEVSFSRVPCFDFHETEQSHFYLARSMLPYTDVKQRLLRKYQDFRYAAYSLKLEDREFLLDHLIGVDKSFMKKGYSDPMVPEFSFTFLDWRLTEELIHGKIELKDISDERFEQICFNIFPDGSHLLHLAASMRSHKLLEEIIQRIQDIKKDFFEVPFERDFNQKTCLHHLCESEDLQMVDSLMRFLTKQKIDHHSRAIYDILPQVLSFDIPSFVAYMDSRLMQTPETKKITHGDINAATHGIGFSSYAVDQGKALELMLEKQNSDEFQSVNQIVVRVQDIHRLHDFKEASGNELMKELSEIPNFEVFDSEVIQNMITFKYKAVQRATIRKLLVPYLVWLVIFFVYSDFITWQYRMAIITKEKIGVWLFIVLVFQILNGIFAAYFLINEYRQISREGYGYFASVWNYIDLAPPVFIIIASISFYTVKQQEQLSDWEISLRALAAFFMWIKLLYFLRIFKEFGYLIRSIVQVVADMQAFLGVLFLTLFAFGEAFYQISMGNLGKGEFIPIEWLGPLNAFVYIYRIALGDFDLEEMSKRVPGLVLVFFFACTIFNMIIMLNLLIAIISKSFEEVDSNALYAGFQEKAKIVSENSYLVAESTMEEHCAQDSLLITAVGKDDLRKQAEDEQKEDGVNHMKQLLEERLKEILEEVRRK